MASHTFYHTPLGPFDLLGQNSFFGGWNLSAEDSQSIVMAFPVEGWQGSAAVTLKQLPDGRILGTAYGEEGCLEKAAEQALAALSLDVDATGWPEIGKKDPFIGSLQERYGFLRPDLFHSPYEAAAHFIIGHRISGQQARALRKKLAETHGESVEISGTAYPAFPRPQALLAIQDYPGLNDTKIIRLHAVAQAALDGLLDRAYLRSIPIPQALMELETLPGVGPFFSQGILHRGAGLVDELTDEDVSKHGLKTAYELPGSVTFQDVETLAERWRPFRMWALVLIHVWVRRELGMPEKRTFSPKKPQA